MAGRKQLVDEKQSNAVDLTYSIPKLPSSIQPTSFRVPRSSRSNKEIIIQVKIFFYVFLGKYFDTFCSLDTTEKIPQWELRHISQLGNSEVLVRLFENHQDIVVELVRLNQSSMHIFVSVHDALRWWLTSSLKINAASIKPVIKILDVSTMFQKPMCSPELPPLHALRPFFSVCQSSANVPFDYFQRAGNFFSNVINRHTLNDSIRTDIISKAFLPLLMRDSAPLLFQESVITALRFMLIGPNKAVPSLTVADTEQEALELLAYLSGDDQVEKKAEDISEPLESMTLTPDVRNESVTPVSVGKPSAAIPPPISLPAQSQGSNNPETMVEVDTAASAPETPILEQAASNMGLAVTPKVPSEHEIDSPHEELFVAGPSEFPPSEDNTLSAPVPAAPHEHALFSLLLPQHVVRLSNILNNLSASSASTESLTDAQWRIFVSHSTTIINIIDLLHYCRKYALQETKDVASSVIREELGVVAQRYENLKVAMSHTREIFNFDRSLD